MKVFKRRNSLAGLSIFAFLLMLLVIGSFAGCEAASMIPVKNRQATQVCKVIVLCRLNDVLALMRTIPVHNDIVGNASYPELKFA